MPFRLSPRSALCAATLLSGLIGLACAGQSNGSAPVPAKPVAYLGQPLPGETPVLFAPSLITSFSPFAAAPTFSIDGTRVLVGVGSADYSTAKIYEARWENGTWSAFKEPSFLSGFTFSHEPVFSADGSSLTFTGTAGGSQSLWTVPLTAQGWGTPTPLPDPINDPNAGEWRGSTAKNGNFYFGSDRVKPAYGLMQIFKATRDANQKLVVEALPAPVNMKAWDGDPCIAPDERFLVFYSCRGGASSDLYVSFKDAQGAWGEPILLGPEFNTAGDEYGAYLSQDGKYLFFTRHTAKGDQIFWVSVTAIDKLKSA